MAILKRAWLRRVDWIGLLPWGAIALLLVLLLTHSWFGPDIWYHLSWGRSLVNNLSFLPVTNTLLDQPIFANVYWFFQVFVYGLFQWGGIYALSFVFGVLWLVVAALWITQSHAGRMPHYGPLLTLAFVVCAQLRFEPRPEVFSYVFLSVLVGTLAHVNLTAPLAVRLRQLFLLFSLQVLWTNSHSYFALGPCVAVAFYLALLWDRQYALLRPALSIVAVILLATIVSPFTWNTWLMVLAYTKVSHSLRTLNMELMRPTLLPLFWPYTVFWCLWLLITFGSALALIKRRATFAAFLALGGSFLAAQATRNIPLLLILGAPILGAVLQFNLLSPRQLLLRRALQVVPGAIALALSAMVITGEYHKSVRSLGTFGIHLEKSAYPIEATDYLKQIKFNGRIFNDSYDGGYLEFHLPDVKIVGDSYFSDAAVTHKYLDAIRKIEVLRELDKRFNFDALLINIENMDVVQALLADEQWNCAFVATHHLLFMRHPQFDELTLDLSKSRFYDGADLTHWTYGFGLSSWAGLAMMSENAALMQKILRDLHGVTAVPADVVRFALILGLRKNDTQLMHAALAFSDRSFAQNPGDLERLPPLTAKARSALGL